MRVRFFTDASSDGYAMKRRVVSVICGRFGRIRNQQQHHAQVALNLDPSAISMMSIFGSDAHLFTGSLPRPTVRFPSQLVQFQAGYETAASNQNEKQARGSPVCLLYGATRLNSASVKGPTCFRVNCQRKRPLTMLQQLRKLCRLVVTSNKGRGNAA